MSALNRIQQPLGKLQGKVAVITGEILQWVLENAKTPRAPWEIETWSAFMEKRGPDSDAETLALFAEYVGQHSKHRARRGKSKPGRPSWKNEDQTATRKRLHSLPNTWVNIPKPAKTSKPGSKPLSSMIMPALEESRKSLCGGMRQV